VEIYERIDFGELFPDQSQLRDNIYTLYAIIVHIGQTTDTGHYYTLIRDEKNEKIWYSLNDSLCYLIDNINKITDIFKSHTVDTPYMLFYKRTGKK
jgi:ubiquitin C-terminal hydrolase